MPWIQFHIKTTADYAHSLSDQLTLLGALAVTFQDAGNQPIYEPPPGAIDLWPEIIVIGLFDHTLSHNPILTYLEQQQANRCITHFDLHHLPEQDWERVCLDHFNPTQFGQRLWICPSWLTPPNPNAVNVILDPGLAFGTGTHPTTALCLQWLDQTVSNQKLVIDYGCGSGILGLAALKLGAARVIAVDHDSQALETTKENVARNPDVAASRLITCLPDELTTDEPADILIANILANPLIKLASRFAELTQSGSRIVLSGILSHQVNELTKAYARWFELEASQNSTGEWIRLTGFRR